jgi:excisionase family DNA binding protein
MLCPTPNQEWRKELDFTTRMNTKQAAEYLGVSTDWLLEKLESKNIPYYKPAHRYYFVKEELDQWLQTTRCKNDYTYSNTKMKKQVVLL